MNDALLVAVLHGFQDLPSQLWISRNSTSERGSTTTMELHPLLSDRRDRGAHAPEDASSLWLIEPQSQQEVAEAARFLGSGAHAAYFTQKSLATSCCMIERSLQG